MGRRSRSRRVGPADGVPRKLHVSDQRLYGGFAHQPHKEELRDEAGRDGAQRRQAQQQATEALRLMRVVDPLVLRQRHLELLLQGLDVGGVSQATGVCKEGKVRSMARVGQ